MEAFDILRQEHEESLPLSAAKSLVCLCRALLRDMDKQSRPHLRQLPHVLRLHRPSVRSRRLGNNQMASQRPLLLRLRAGRSPRRICQWSPTDVHRALHYL